MSPNLPLRHKFPNILLRYFYREVPLVEVGSLLKKANPRLKVSINIETFRQEEKIYI